MNKMEGDFPFIEDYFGGDLDHQIISILFPGIRMLDCGIQYLNRPVTDAGLRTGFIAGFYTLPDKAMEPSFSMQFEMQSDLSQLEQAREFVRNFCRCNAHWPVREEEICQIQLAVHEAAANIIRHAYQNQCGKRIVIEGVCLVDRIMFRLNHWGLSFERASVPPPVFDGTTETGYGLYIMEYCTDSVQYNFDEKGTNIISITKNRTAG